MNEVLVLGSRPNPTIPINCNSVYFVNGAISYEKKFNQSDNKTHFFANGMLHRDTSQASVNRGFISNSKINDFICVQFILKNNNEKLNQLICHSFELKEISRQIKGAIERKVLGFRYFLNLILTGEFSFLEKIKFVLFIVKKKEYKLSTGLFCVLYELDIRSNSKIIIAGVGFGKNEYSWFSDPSNGHKLRGHFINDFIALKTLSSSKYYKRIETTEVQLHKLFNIPLYKGECTTL